MISFKDFKDELIPITLFKHERREDYYRIYMDEGIIIEDAYKQLLKCEAFIQ